MTAVFFAVLSSLAGLDRHPSRYADMPDETYVFDAAFAAVSRADLAAERAWADLKTSAEIADRRRTLRDKTVTAIGGLPEKTPLKPQSFGIVPRDGYTVEKLVFESRPFHYVTAHFYLPDEVKFPRPLPGVVIACGHTPLGKSSREIQRAAVILAQAGFATLVYDPIDQGERTQLPGSGLETVHGHTNLGLRAHLLGWSTAQFRIWDGIRAHDYLLSRPEANPARTGVTGMSGGGTLCSYLNALDTRFRAASPMAYLTSMRALALRSGPQDAEQVIFGQLAFGLNHLALMLINGESAIMPGFTYGDFFPYDASLATYEQAAAFFAREGRASEIDFFDCPGRHGWYESEKQALAKWMRRHLADDESAWPIDKDAYRRLDPGFSYAHVDAGLPKESGLVLDGKGVMSLPDARSAYDFLTDELDRLEQTRAKTPDRETVRTACGLGDTSAVELALKEREEDGLRVRTAALERRDGFRVNVAAFLPTKVRGTPVFIADDTSAPTNRMPLIRQLVAEGRPVAYAQARGFGPMSTCWPRNSYWSKKGPDQELAALYAWLGENLAVRRAEDYLAAGAWFQKQTGGPAELRTAGGAVVAAAHAFYFGRDRFASFVSEDRPPFWTESVRAPRTPLPRFSDLVYGALKVYDWPMLVDSARDSVRKRGGDPRFPPPHEDSLRKDRQAL